MCLPLIRIATLLPDVPPHGALSLSLDYLPELVSLLSPDDELRVFTDFNQLLARPDGNGGAMFSTVDRIASMSGEVEGDWRLLCFHTGGGEEGLRVLPVHPYPAASMTITPMAGRDDMCFSIWATPVATRSDAEVVSTFLMLCRMLQGELGGSES